jgi:hypothetical protein
MSWAELIQTGVKREDSQMMLSSMILLVALQPVPQTIGNLELKLLTVDADLRRELNLSGEQLSKLGIRLAEIGRRHLGRQLVFSREQVIAHRDSDSQKAIVEVLTPKQIKRLTEIQIQIEGAVAFTKKPVEDALALDDRQKVRCQKLVDEMNLAMQQIKDDVDAEARKKREQGEMDASRNIRAQQQALDEQWTRSFRKAYAALSAEQKAKWKVLTGEQFNGANCGAWRRVAMNRPGVAGR